MYHLCRCGQPSPSAPPGPPPQVDGGRATVLQHSCRIFLREFSSCLKKKEKNIYSCVRQRTNQEKIRSHSWFSERITQNSKYLIKMEPFYVSGEKNLFFSSHEILFWKIQGKEGMMKIVSLFILAVQSLVGIHFSITLSKVIRQLFSKISHSFQSLFDLQ